MTRQKLTELAQSTADAAFIVDEAGEILAWNEAASDYFGLTASRAVGRFCGDLMNGWDECGPVCGEHCSVRQAVRNRRPVRNFDLLTDTSAGRLWCNVSVMLVADRPGEAPFAVHIVRPIDVRKRLEMTMRDFLRTASQSEQADAMAGTRRLTATNAPLTARETEVLGLLALGRSSAAIADLLHVSRKTVSNHIQHAMEKLNATTRLEAVRKAELAGII